MYTILGATGNIGSKLAEILVKQGEEVRLVSRTADRLLPSLMQKARKDETFVGNAQSYVGDILDTEFLSKALEDSRSVFTMIPPNPKVDNFLTYANRMSESIARAIEIAKVKYVVNISSVGADLSDGGTGPITGLHNLEERLNRIKGLNVMHIRAGYFMENLFSFVDLIRSRGITGSAIRGDLKIPMIATRDIADFVAKHLVKCDFSGSSVAYLLGQRDLSLIEATAIIGNKIGNPDLKYILFPYDDAEKSLIAAGLSPNMSQSYIEMSRAFNEGRINRSFKRTRTNTTATSFETFCEEVFMPVCLNKKKAA
ncbi:MAG TPA: NAD(P)H-binding protein [Nitrospirota bacterium]|nr:NAD(P)H-binding protein [Nitrospirota bacterium]